jgi:hypothetical protein
MLAGISGIGRKAIQVVVMAMDGRLLFVEKIVASLDVGVVIFLGTWSPATKKLNAAGRTEDSTAVIPARRVAGGLCPFIIPAGTRDTLTQTRTHGFGLVTICGLQR